MYHYIYIYTYIWLWINTYIAIDTICSGDELSIIRSDFDEHGILEVEAVWDIHTWYPPKLKLEGTLW